MKLLTTYRSFGTKIILPELGDKTMEKGKTKQAILEASLELFSKQGFEATSVSQIAELVGIRKASKT